MCSIAGVFPPIRSFAARDAAFAAVRRMNAVLAHRGPDGDEVWVASVGFCILGHRRLSAIGTSGAGKQPMLSHDGRRVIAFNGEIYNYRELRR
ncbi:MAG: asparagine synthetase B, partial [Alphaproteobacteria bacterium]|nr:asparagine synthetase B [Alphaproteobacteria bacterium]